jgi:hypothetical protein
MSMNRPSFFRPQLEALEDRSLPNNFFHPVVGFGDDVLAPQAQQSSAGADLFLAAVTNNRATGNLGNPGVAPLQSNPHGASYATWSARWWQYALAIPADQSPFLDTTGANFAVNQSGNVWYLSGVFCLNMNGQPCPPGSPATADRTVTLAAGTSLFFPVLNAETDNLNIDPNSPGFGTQNLGFSVDQLRAQAKAFIDDAVQNGVLAVTVDGRALQNVASYRVTSPVFSYTLPDNNIAGVPAQTVTPAVSDGIFVMLRPLPVGQHTIEIIGSAPNFDFALDVTYHITVTPGK